MYNGDDGESSDCFERAEVSNEDLENEIAKIQSTSERNDESSLMVDHLQDLGWPDKNAPVTEQMYEDIDVLIEQMLAKRQVSERVQAMANDSEPKQAAPMVVHCSAGLGRTGTLCAIYNIIEAIAFSSNRKMFEKLKRQEYYSVIPRRLKENEPPKLSPLRMSIFGCVRKLREQRMKMVTELVQYQFLYKYMARWVDKQIEQDLL